MLSSAWLPELELTPATLQAAAATVPTGSFADFLLRAVQATLTDAAQAKMPLAGRALFDALDRRCSGQLAAWLAAALPPVVLPQLWLALAGELS